MPTVLYRFASIADLRDNLGTRMGATRIPQPWLSAIFAALPKFIVDATLVCSAGEKPSDSISGT
jgi:hypothetical protein